MIWRKAPESLITLFDSILPKDDRVERRKMFGYPAAFINGNLFASLFQESCILRLRENDRDEMRVVYGARNFEPMAGRIMREYVVVPDEILVDVDAMREWITRAMDFGATLAPKVKAGAKKAARAPKAVPGSTSKPKSAVKKAKSRS